MDAKLVFEGFKMPGLFKSLNTSELKLMLIIAYYMVSKGKNLFINNADGREFLSSMEFRKTPVRICNLLSSLVKKGALVKEGTGVYSIPEGLLFLPKDLVVSATPEEPKTSSL